MLDGSTSNYLSYEESIAAQPEEPISDECVGGPMYSSGTTGRPKGVSRELSLDPLPYSKEDGDPSLSRVLLLYGANEESIYLSPAPMYHSAPLNFCTAFLAEGSTCVILEKFDAEGALRAIQEHRCAHSQWVPTMFVRF